MNVWRNTRTQCTAKIPSCFIAYIATSHLKMQECLKLTADKITWTYLAMDVIRSLDPRRHLKPTKRRNMKTLDEAGAQREHHQCFFVMFFCAWTIVFDWQLTQSTLYFRLMRSFILLQQFQHLDMRGIFLMLQGDNNNGPVIDTGGYLCPRSWYRGIFCGSVVDTGG